MGLAKRSLKGLIEYSDLRNNDGVYSEDDVIGVSTDKRMIPTKADLDGVNLLNYKLFPPKSFAYVADTSRRGDKIALAYNNTSRTFIVSTWYVVFQMSDEAEGVLSSDYLFLFFNRSEFDRYARTNSWGSAREYFWFQDMEEIVIDLPPYPVQQKYVDFYNAMVANQQSYERGLEDLKLVCDGYIEDMRRKTPCEKIGPYIELIETTNDNLHYDISAVRGVSIEKKFIETKADMTGVNLAPYLVVQPNEFAYVTVTSRNGEKISIALNESEDTYICSSSYVAFRSKDDEFLLPQYLMLFLSRSEFNRYARFHSIGSARETFDWDELCNVQIPIPDIQVQKAIAEIYSVYIMRKKINEQLKAQIKDICPILIKGSLEDTK